VEAVRTFVLRGAEYRPLLLLAEDLHAAGFLTLGTLLGTLAAIRPPDVLLAAAVAGAALGLVASPNPPRDGQAENLAWTAAAAVQTAQHSEERTRSAERALVEARARLNQVADAVQEMQDFQEAKRLGLDQAMSDRGGFTLDDRRRVLAAIVRESRRRGLDPVMVAAVIEIESRFDPYARSHVGACGLMQLMPPTAKELLATPDARIDSRHLFNPVLNIELGTAYLARLLLQFDGDLHRALIAYNAGPSVARSLVRGSKSYRRLQGYPRAVLTTYRAFLLAQQATGARLAQG
jgi:soluble lytic murein transglycosylase-like protein